MFRPLPTPSAGVGDIEEAHNPLGCVSNTLAVFFFVEREDARLLRPGDSRLGSALHGMAWHGLSVSERAQGFGLPSATVLRVGFGHLAFPEPMRRASLSAARAVGVGRLARLVWLPDTR
jgi:hypothetical protein